MRRIRVDLPPSELPSPACRYRERASRALTAVRRRRGRHQVEELNAKMKAAVDGMHAQTAAELDAMRAQLYQGLEARRQVGPFPSRTYPKQSRLGRV